MKKERLMNFVSEDYGDEDIKKIYKEAKKKARKYDQNMMYK